MQVRVQAAPDESAWGWELGFGLVWVGGEQTIRARKGRRERREGAACCTCSCKCTCKVNANANTHTGRKSRRREKAGECVVDSASYSPKICCAARAREDDTNRRAQPENEVRPLFS